MNFTETELAQLIANRDSPDCDTLLESPLQKAAEDWLRRNNIQYIHLKKVRCPHCSKWFNSDIYVGFPDLEVYSNQGSVFTEFKSKSGRLSPAQKDFFRYLPKHYVHKYVIRNINDFEKVVGCIQKGKVIPKKLLDRIGVRV